MNDNQMELTPQERAKEIFINCYPHELDNGIFMKKCWARKYALIVVDAILEETLSEYTNDENHVRVTYWNNVKLEINKMEF